MSDNIVSGETIKTVRSMLNITQGEFAVLLGVNHITVSNWENHGIDPIKNRSYNKFRYLVAFLKQVSKKPGPFSVQQIKKLLNATAKKNLLMLYPTTTGEMDKDFLSCVQDGNLTSLLFILFFDYVMYADSKESVILAGAEDSRNTVIEIEENTVNQFRNS